MSREHQTAILVVDDELVIRDICSRALEEYRTFQAASMQEALALYDKEKIDLVLTDVMMPGGSGIELMQEIKRRDPAAVIVVMTGFSDKDTVLKALRADADDFLDKPVNLLHLKTTVKKALAKKELKEEIAVLRQMDSLKGAFLTQIAHKLRTPLTALSLGLEEMERYAVRTGLGNSYQERLVSMHEDVATLSQVLTSVLRISQIMGRQSRHLVRCDLAEVVRSAVEATERSSEKAGVALQLDLHGAAVVVGDRDRLIFCLQQLLENAFKFTASGGAVSVELTAGSGDARVRITDTGCGIPADEMAKIFEQCYQVDPDDTGQVPGLGLGLFCAREIVRQHGGTLMLTSVPNQGTTVDVALKTVEE